jgi:small subunit ribosomal protein S6
LNTYETVFLLKPEMETEKVTEQIEFYKELISKNNGEILNCEPWGKKILAYTIDSCKEAYYVLIQFKADSDLLLELERRYKYNELVLRHVIVKIDEKRFKLKPQRDAQRSQRRPHRKPEDTEKVSEEFIEEIEKVEDTTNIE